MSYARRTSALVLSGIEDIQSSKFGPLLAAIIRQLNDKLGITATTGSNTVRGSGPIRPLHPVATSLSSNVKFAPLAKFA
jgi:hypothetical protein